MPENYSIPQWPYVYGGPQSQGKLKAQAIDFMVREKLPFQPEGNGEHVFIQIEKVGENTEYIARLLARFAGVRQRDIGFAGLKDRQAVTRQWFSVWLPGKDEPDWGEIESDNIRVLQTQRHLRKLKRGVLSENEFEIRIRDCKGDRAMLEQQLQKITKQGIANYFGPQRFGIQGQNLNKALALFDGAKVKKELKSIYLSAVRSYLFNQLLAERVANNTWNKAIAGDVLIFDNSNSYFKFDQQDESVQQRVAVGKIHPSGMLCGDKKLETSALVYQLENRIVAENPKLIEGLLKFHLNNDRRSLRVFASNLQWQFETDHQVVLSFALPPGSYATSLLREVFNTD